jgi:formylglycine-generating enzyme required for sulfatase activity
MAEPVPLKYRAFISYSHQDTTWAKWLQRGLEGFKIDKDLAGRETARGTIPESLRPIFRDREDFTAGETLPEQTVAALDASRALIVVCSPDSARSNYVNEEARQFKSRHPDRPVIPLIVGGKPDDPERECFPPALKFKFDTKGRTTKKKAELLAADAREEGDGKDLALAKIIAGLLGLSSDDVFRRAERERQVVGRRRRRVRALVAALAVLLALGGLGWWKQGYFRDQYYWHFVMRPSVLTANQEDALEPGEEFSECANGCPTMVVVPSGKFTMGEQCDQNQYPCNGPAHDVSFARQFAIGKYEVTFDEWDACVASGGCSNTSDSKFGRGTQPAINVSWDDAKLYVDWLSRVTGETYRLPSEAEWEYAARAGSSTLYFFGDDPKLLKDYAWYGDSAGAYPHPVGTTKPNTFGLHDAHGNVWELVEDGWYLAYEDAPSDGSARPLQQPSPGYTITEDDLEGGGDSRTVRGGSFKEAAEDVRSTVRQWINPSARRNDMGFRVARTLDQ